jgi:pimeloyl-ACP methyl ester carboxylesterase
MNSECLSLKSGELRYRVRPGSSDLWIVFVHGAGGDSSLFERQFQGIDSRWSLAAPDLPGHGDSAPAGQATVETYRDAVMGLLAALKAPRAVLVGHSMGGGVIIEAQRAAGPRVAGLVFLACGPALPVSPAIFDLIEKDFTAFGVMAGRFICGQGGGGELEMLVRRGLERTGREQTWRDFSICSRYDYLPLLGELRVPALVIANSSDAMVSVKGAAKLARAMKSSVLKVYESTGHMPHWDHADEVNRDIEEFCLGLQGQGILHLP